MSPEIISLFEVAGPDKSSPFQFGERSSENGGLKMHPCKWKGLHGVRTGERKQAQGTCS